MILGAFLIGMCLCALTLMLIRVEDTSDKFASAVAMFSAWCGFGMLMIAGLWGLGLPIPLAAGALVLGLRFTNLGNRLPAFAAYKMPLGVAALVACVATWIGVLNLMKEFSNG